MPAKQDLTPEDFINDMYGYRHITHYHSEQVIAAMAAYAAQECAKVREEATTPIQIALKEVGEQVERCGTDIDARDFADWVGADIRDKNRKGLIMLTAILVRLISELPNDKP